MQWLEEQLEIMPISYLRRNTPEQIAAHLNVLGRLARGEVHVEYEYVAATGLTRLTVITHDALVPGIFSKVAGVLAAAWIEIIAAQIITRPDGLLVDTFEGIDADYDGEPPPHRGDELKTNIRDVLLGRRAVEGLFRERMSPHRPPPEPRRAPPRVEIDNDSSGRFTIVEVFASDRPRLLYDLTRTLFELGLSVSSARISTHIDQVVDAFYVSTRAGEKIAEDALEGIRGRLLGMLNAGTDGNARAGG
jgi:[protein-PII] uridylyltransferase